MSDHYPTCPRCGNLCGRLAARCADCHAKLYELDSHAADRLSSTPMQRPTSTPEGEAVPPARERED